jgi:hypothetical protein
MRVGLVGWLVGWLVARPKNVTYVPACTASERSGIQQSKLSLPRAFTLRYVEILFVLSVLHSLQTVPNAQALRPPREESTPPQPTQATCPVADSSPSEMARGCSWLGDGFGGALAGVAPAQRWHRTQS